MLEADLAHLPETGGENLPLREGVIALLLDSMKLVFSILGNVLEI
jgi:hypothetical protein